MVKRIARPRWETTTTAGSDFPLSPISQVSFVPFNNTFQVPLNAPERSETRGGCRVGPQLRRHMGARSKKAIILTKDSLFPIFEPYEERCNALLFIKSSKIYGALEKLTESEDPRISPMIFECQSRVVPSVLHGLSLSGKTFKCACYPRTI
jgi:hypothetical protein